MCTILVQIVFLNLLIAIMGDTFDRVQEAKAQSEVKEILSMMEENYFLLNRKKTFERCKYIIVAELERAEYEEKSWEGKIKKMRSDIQKGSKDLKGEIKCIRSGMNQMHTKMEGDFEKINSSLRNSIFEVKNNQDIMKREFAS